MEGGYDWSGDWYSDRGVDLRRREPGQGFRLPPDLPERRERTGPSPPAAQEAPYGFLLKASGSGAPGTVSAEARVRLAAGDGGTTTVSYDADAVVGGMVGGVGQRVLTGVARRTAGEFFAAVDDVLNGAAVEGQEPAEVAVFERPPGAAVRAVPGDFARGVAFGAAAALLGVVVGALIGRRRS